MDYAKILAEAHEAAKQAGADLPDNGACGFAWVTVPGNSALARWCRLNQPADAPYATGRGYYGDKGYPGGYQWWSPGYGGQSIDARERCACAFRDVLGAYGIRADVHSRLD